MIDLAAIALGLAAGSVAVHVWRAIYSPSEEDLKRVENDHSRRVGKLEEKVKWLQNLTALPRNGPYRTSAKPLGDPNIVSALPDPTPLSAATQLLPWDDHLICPVCDCDNRWLSSEGEEDAINTKTHTSCNGCSVIDTPHLHVECWNCEFKYAVRAASESKDE